MCGSAHAQTKKAIPLPEMELCSVPLTIGMTKAAFMDKVVSVCELIKVPLANEDSWLLKLKGPDGKPEGSVTFAAGVLAEVKRSWVLSDGQYEAADFARGLVSAVEAGLQKRSSAAGIVYYSISRHPDMTYYQLVLELPDHREVRVELMENPTKAPGKRVTMLDVTEAIVK